MKKYKLYFLTACILPTISLIACSNTSNKYNASNNNLNKTIQEYKITVNNQEVNLNHTFNLNDQVTIEYTKTQENQNYQWQMYINNQWINVVNATKNKLILNINNYSNNQYRLVINENSNTITTNPININVAQVASAQLDINLTDATINANLITVENDSTVKLSYDGNNHSNVSYKWIKENDQETKIVANTKELVLSNFTNLDINHKDQYKLEIYTNNHLVAASNSFTISKKIIFNNLNIAFNDAKSNILGISYLDQDTKVNLSSSLVTNIDTKELKYTWYELINGIWTSVSNDQDYQFNYQKGQIRTFRLNVNVQGRWNINPLVSNNLVFETKLPTLDLTKATKEFKHWVENKANLLALYQIWANNNLGLFNAYLLNGVGSIKVLNLPELNNWEFDIDDSGYLIAIAKVNDDQGTIGVFGSSKKPTKIIKIPKDSKIKFVLPFNIKNTKHQTNLIYSVLGDGSTIIKLNNIAPYHIFKSYEASNNAIGFAIFKPNSDFNQANLIFKAEDQYYNKALNVVPISNWVFVHKKFRDLTFSSTIYDQIPFYGSKENLIKPIIVIDQSHNDQIIPLLPNQELSLNIKPYLSNNAVDDFKIQWYRTTNKNDLNDESKMELINQANSSTLNITAKEIKGHTLYYYVAKVSTKWNNHLISSYSKPFMVDFTDGLTLKEGWENEVQE
ncbi:hypothetical protein GE118_02865 [Mycoplasma sp. NEAQ87857]|uniref:hypothetical protein n=1 Tax=Mycoplasma sp. NEAQ87857 TaxID=2683967 RepID=UPI001316DEC5|nr:hypothetical protein [Mycoplasma sp. NEAQ87857]QGZ97731.1 hypothetical protein GE118_02865 [Mycoplasma sp. NEAQ87857]